MPSSSKTRGKQAIKQTINPVGLTSLTIDHRNAHIYYIENLSETLQNGIIDVSAAQMYHAHIPNLKQEVQQAKLTALRIEHFKK